MNKYKVDGMRAITCEDAEYAAETFAGRLARKEYGRNAVFMCLRLNCWAIDGSYGEYNVFVGKHDKYNGGVSGHNISFYMEEV